MIDVLDRSISFFTRSLQKLLARGNELLRTISLNILLQPLKSFSSL